MNAHPLADLFPLMTGPAFADLCADIGQHGLREPIVMHEGMVLDGRNRLQACIETGTPPEFREWDGPGTALDYVISMNLVRRHLNDSQRAAVGADMANINRGDFAGNQHVPSANLQTPQISHAKAAALVNLSERSIADAVKVKARSPELFAALKEGIIAVSQAAQLADADPAHQLGVLGKIRAGLPVMEARRQLKRETLETTSWPECKYRVLLIDPAWRYGNDLARCMTGSTSAADHYPTMSIAELCELPVSSLATDDAVLFLWVPAPLLEECFEVIRAWGFAYKQLIVWDKVEHNYSNYVSSRAELLLICTRGSCLPDGDTRPDNVVSIEKSAVHSEKPEAFRKLIDELYPHGPRIELFARQRHEGWDVWGE